MSFLRSVPVRIATVVAIAGTAHASTPSALAHSGGHGLDPTSDGPPLLLEHDETLFEDNAAPSKAEIKAKNP